MQATTKQLEACARLNAQEPGFLEFLEARLEDTRSNAVMQRDEVSMRWAQGRAQELVELIKLVTTAQDLLRKVDR